MHLVADVVGVANCRPYHAVLAPVEVVRLERWEKHVGHIGGLPIRAPPPVLLSLVRFITGLVEDLAVVDGLEVDDRLHGPLVLSEPDLRVQTCGCRNRRKLLIRYGLDARERCLPCRVQRRTCCSAAQVRGWRREAHALASDALDPARRAPRRRTRGGRMEGGYDPIQHRAHDFVTRTRLVLVQVYPASTDRCTPVDAPAVLAAMLVRFRLACQPVGAGACHPCRTRPRTRTR